MIVNSRTALNIGVAVATLALGAFLYFALQDHRSDVPEHFTLLGESIDNLERIEISRPGKNAIVLERSGQHWRMTTPRAARLDEIQVARILDVARFRATQRMAAEDLDRFELDKPWAQIRFNQRAIAFGTTNSLTQELYVLSNGHVYAVPARLAAAVPADPARLLAHPLFAADEQPVAFEMKDFSVRHDGVRWQLMPHDPGLSQDDLIRWVEQWRLASSVTTQPARKAQQAESLKIGLRDARTVVVSILERAPNLVLLRHDEQLEYHLPAGRASTLLLPPNAAAAQKQ